MRENDDESHNSREAALAMENKELIQAQQIAIGVELVKNSIGELVPSATGITRRS